MTPLISRSVFSASAGEVGRLLHSDASLELFVEVCSERSPRILTIGSRAHTDELDLLLLLLLLRLGHEMGASGGTVWPTLSIDGDGPFAEPQPVELSLRNLAGSFLGSRCGFIDLFPGERRKFTELSSNPVEARPNGPDGNLQGVADCS